MLVESGGCLISRLEGSVTQVFDVLLFVAYICCLNEVPSPVIAGGLGGASRARREKKDRRRASMRVRAASRAGKAGRRRRKSATRSPSPSPFSRRGRSPSGVSRARRVQIGKGRGAGSRFCFGRAHCGGEPTCRACCLSKARRRRGSGLRVFGRGGSLFRFRGPIMTVLFSPGQ